MTGNTPSEAEKHCKSTKTLTVSYKEGEILFFFFLLSSFRRAISIFLNRSHKKKKKKNSVLQLSPTPFLPNFGVSQSASNHTLNNHDCNDWVVLGQLFVLCSFMFTLSEPVATL